MLGISNSIRLAKALHSILVSQDITDMGRYDVLSRGHLPGFKRREMTAALKDGGKIPFSHDSLNISKIQNNKFPANVLHNSIGRPSGPAAFPLLKSFNASINSSTHKCLPRSVLASSVYFGKWSLCKKSVCFPELFSELFSDLNKSL